MTDPQVYRALVIGRYCAAFHCTPLQAIRDIDNDPDQLGLMILDFRGFEAAKQALDAWARNPAGDLAAWADSPYMALVQEFTIEARQRAVLAFDAAAQKAQADGR